MQLELVEMGCAPQRPSFWAAMARQVLTVMQHALLCSNLRATDTVSTRSFCVQCVLHAKGEVVTHLLAQLRLGALEVCELRLKLDDRSLCSDHVLSIGCCAPHGLQDALQPLQPRAHSSKLSWGQLGSTSAV